MNMKYAICFLTLTISLNSSVFAADGVVGAADNNLTQGLWQGGDATPTFGVGGNGFLLTIDGGTNADSVIDNTTSYVGGKGYSTGGGHGLEIDNSSGIGLNSLTNNGTLQGGEGADSSAAGAGGGNGIILENINITTLTNNGDILGGNARMGSNGLYLFSNANVGTIINTGNIIAGDDIYGNANGRGGAGIAIESNSSASIQNSGFISGGNSLGSNRAGHGIYTTNSNGTVLIENTGIIQGGNAVSGNGGKGVFVDSNTTIHLINAGTIAGGTGGANPIAVQLGTSGNIIELHSGGVFIGEIYAISGNQTFIVNATQDSVGNTLDLSQITGTGWNNSTFEKQGSYDWILSNTTATNVRTNWSITDGNLIVGATNDGTTINGTVDVNSGTLSGHGIVKGRVTVNSGAAISPGNNSLGTLTVGDITFASGSTYIAQANPDNNNDLIKVTATGTSGTGTATINGGTVVVKAGAGTWQANTLYTILEADNNLTATDRFDGVTVDLAFLNASLDYSVLNQVNLILTRNGRGFADIAITRNQKQTAKGISTLPATHPIVTEILSMSALGARNAYDNLSGEIHASAQAALINDRYVRDAINEHLLDRFETKGAGLWLATWGATENLRSDNNAAKLGNNVFGMMVGYDKAFDETTQFGLALGYQHNNIDLNKGRRSNAEIDSYHVAAYLGKEFDHGISLRTGLDYAYLNLRTDRRVEVGNIKEKNQDSYHGHLVQGFVELSKNVNVTNQLQVEPYLNVAHVYVTTRLNEGNNVTALKGSGENQVTFSTTGFRAKFKATDKVKLVLGTGWQHAFGNLKADTDLKFKGSDYFNINGAPITRDAVIAELGAEYNLSPNTTIGINYQGQFGNKLENNAIKAGINYRF
ncbi:autotransporter family protein [Entomomonas asaccharolytica]|uniref:Autotransporter domain-containing protein n=1 Tax=Entomomonas asaccharolytica TaxID=2785331 RepID=A0A974RXJ0_9GAMM|nr:autotransporter outer membrane beta-barrel domain-containing protein [Entomomonas asaccharolytica]QQP86225.1 autotransporter domain-containing protein [Entomomonas asaccharolytica]